MYADLSRLPLYYEEHGDPTSPPVILLHGGMSGAQTWELQLKALGQNHRILAPEQQGHGHTQDLDAPFSYQAMADDTIEFLELIAGQPAHLVGHSDGGILALLIALQRPDLVRRAVLIGANFHRNGLRPSEINTGNLDNEDFAKALDRYAQFSPDGAGHWPIIVHKTQQMWINEPSLSISDLATITPPTLVMVGDNDVITHDHTVQLYGALAESQLAIVPGTSHSLRKEKPALVNYLILEFLTDFLLPSEIKASS